VLEHLTKPETAFHSMVLSMKPGGYLFITVPFFEMNHGSPHDFHRFTYHALFMYAQNENLCVHKVGGQHQLAKDVYTISYLIAQKQPCEQDAEILRLPDLMQLQKDSGYTLR